MTDKFDQRRYLFTVRQRFGEDPIIDTFYELQVPAGLTSDQAAIMTKLNSKFCKQEMSEDTQALNGMQMRLRFNADMFPKVCLVRTEISITAEELEAIVQMKNKENELISFLEKSAI